MLKDFEDLTVADLHQFPVWKFADDGTSEFQIEPLSAKSYPDLGSLIIGSELRFQDGTSHCSIFQNVSYGGPSVNDHLLTCTIWNGEVWLPLSRYHDFDVDDFGPQQLATAFSRQVSDIFPMTYDLRPPLNSAADGLVGRVLAEPIFRFEKSEIRRLICEEM